MKYRLKAAETVARERQGRIDDLLAALRLLPTAWAERLERVSRQQPGASAWQAGRDEVVDAIWAEDAEASPDAMPAPSPAASEGEDDPEPGAQPPPPAAAPGQTSPLDPDQIAQAEAEWTEVRATRERLEREQLARQLDRLRSRRQR